MLSLLEMSAYGGAMILAVILVRALAINRLPKAMFLALWALTLARLALPVSLPSLPASGRRRAGCPGCRRGPECLPPTGHRPPP